LAQASWAQLTSNDSVRFHCDLTMMCASNAQRRNGHGLRQNVAAHVQDMLPGMLAMPPASQEGDEEMIQSARRAAAANDMKSRNKQGISSPEMLNNVAVSQIVSGDGASKPVGLRGSSRASSVARSDSKDLNSSAPIVLGASLSRPSSKEAMKPKHPTGVTNNNYPVGNVAADRLARLASKGAFARPGTVGCVPGNGLGARNPFLPRSPPTGDVSEKPRLLRARTAAHRKQTQSLVDVRQFVVGRGASPMLRPKTCENGNPSGGAQVNAVDMFLKMRLATKEPRHSKVLLGSSLNSLTSALANLDNCSTAEASCFLKQRCSDEGDYLAARVWGTTAM